MSAKIDELTRQIENDPTNAWLYWERGSLLGSEYQHKLALQDLTKAIELEPDEPEFWRTRGRIHQILGRITYSQNDMNRAVDLAPDAESYGARGTNHRLNHDDDEALKDLDRAVALDPLESDYPYQRGLVWQNRDDLANALTNFDEAIRLEPDHAHYYYARATALLHKKPGFIPEDALPDLETAIRLRPEAEWYKTERGCIRYCQERWTQAADDFTNQDFRWRYSIAPYLGAERVIWIWLARRFEGKPELGREAFHEYMDWYLNEARGVQRDYTRAQRPEAWPVPLARLLAGEIDAEVILNRKDFDASDPILVLYEREWVYDRIREFHFVLAQVALAQGRFEKAQGHLRQAVGLPQRNPMSWVVSRQIIR